MKFLFVTIKEEGDKEKYEYQYHKKVDFKDFTKLGLFFFDLKTNGANIEKAFEAYKKECQEQFPW